MKCKFSSPKSNCHHIHAEGEMEELSGEEDYGDRREKRSFEPKAISHASLSYSENN